MNLHVLQKEEENCSHVGPKWQGWHFMFFRSCLTWKSNNSPEGPLNVNQHMTKSKSVLCARKWLRPVCAGMQSDKSFWRLNEVSLGTGLNIYLRQKTLTRIGHIQADVNHCSSYMPYHRFYHALTILTHQILPKMKKRWMITVERTLGGCELEFLLQWV